MKRRRLLYIVGLLLCSIPSLAQIQGIVEQEKARARSLISNAALAGSQASPDFKVDHYRFEWEVDPAVRYIKGKVTVDISFTASTSAIRFDLSDSLRVDSVLYKNAKLPFSRPGDQTVQITFSSSFTAGTRDSLAIYYQGVPPSAGFGTFATGLHAGTPLMWTLSEPYGSRDWWPCRNGLEDKADSIDVIITTPDSYLSSSNGILANQSTAGGKRTTWWKHRYPIASYLVAIAATNYVVQQDTIQLTGRTLPLEQYVYPESAAAFSASIPRTRRIMRTFEQLISPYPFRNERYAHTQVGFNGGMEHQTNSFMANAAEDLIAHELGHQWFGDKITCGSWQDIWLNEGFAVFMTYLNFESYRDPAINLAWYKSEVELITSEPGGSVFVKDTSSINSIFNYRLTYVKGGWVLQMLRWKLGEAAFYAGIKQYLNDPLVKYGFARTDDFKRNMEAASGQDLDEFFSSWVYGEGYPSYQVSWLPLGSSKVQIKLNQTTSHPSVGFYKMPVPLQFKNSSRDTIIVVDHIRNGQIDIRDIGFTPDTVIFDPYVKLVSANNTVVKGGTSIPSNTVKVYPNPVGSQFNILLLNFQSAETHVTIHNALGQLVYKKELTLSNGNELLTIPSSTWSAGIYLVKVKSKDKDYIERIVK